ncbi:hypothetical protein SARC_09901 [Sphaeroforma arctica JP610]|uniref:Uncharacterized protein n=1 Tax=Sphaeroforma arctica JP610 TaxID=667725 RepID=A0A0L0FNT6_9EUKA|nr:hypothetical protein SARC_09901 [Sphaeroforma arctica JP610]KNC77638.1 hypothetical protein SARC_09901 [Sphaeroforma arctica JP610]|eukprot:XP_014151540.1 hypothetical protein SARC_09901 [Sphaeroforma arctica JP610]
MHFQVDEEADSPTTPRVQYSSRTVKTLLLKALEYGTESNTNLTNAVLTSIERIVQLFGSDIFSRSPYGESVLASNAVTSRQVVDVVFHWLIPNTQSPALTPKVSTKTLALACAGALLLAHAEVLNHNLESFVRLLDYHRHSDQAVRSSVASLVGYYIRAAYDSTSHLSVQNPDDDTISDAYTRKGMLVELCSGILLALLDDTSSQTQKNACLSAGGCVEILLTINASGKNYSRAALDLVTTLCSLLRRDSYWLVQLEALSALAQVNWMMIKYWSELVVAHEFSYPYNGQAKNTLGSKILTREWNVPPSRLQEYALESVIMSLDNGDARIRAQAAKCLTAMCRTLHHESSRGNPPIATVYSLHALSDVLYPLTITGCQRSNSVLHIEDTSQLVPLMGPSYIYESPKLPNDTTASAEGIINGNATRAFSIIVAKMHGVIMPYVKCQSVPPEIFLSTNNTLAGAFVSLADLCRTYGTPPAVHNSVMPSAEGAAIQAQGSLLGNLSDILLLTLDLISCSDLCVDLSLHPLILTLLADLCRYSRSLQFYPHTPRILAHLMRILNVCVHVLCKIDLHLPATEKNKGTAPAQKTDGKDNDLLLAEKACAFVNVPAYVNLYDRLKSAEVGASTTLMTSTDRLGNLVSCALHTLATLIGSIQKQILPMADILLSFLPVLLPVAGPAVINCLHELVKAVMTSAHETGSRSDLNTESRPLTFMQGADLQFGLSGLLGRPLMSLVSQSLGPPRYSGMSSDKSKERVAPKGSGGGINRFPSWPFSLSTTGTGVTAMPTPVGKVNKARFVERIEPILYKALDEYITTSNVEFQKALLALLARLVSSGLNYHRLDKDKTYLSYFQGQVDAIISGHQPYPEALVPYMFQFFVLISRDAQKHQGVISFAKTVQLSERLLAAAVSTNLSISSRERMEMLVLQSLQPILSEILSPEKVSMPPPSPTAVSAPSDLVASRRSSDLMASRRSSTHEGVRGLFSPIQDSSFSLLLSCIHRNYALGMVTEILRRSQPNKNLKKTISSRVWAALVMCMAGVDGAMLAVSHDGRLMHGDWTVLELYDCVSELDLDYTVKRKGSTSVLQDITALFDIAKRSLSIGLSNKPLINMKALSNIALSVVAALRCWCSVPQEFQTELPLADVFEIISALVFVSNKTESRTVPTAKHIDSLFNQIILMLLFLQDNISILTKNCTILLLAKDRESNFVHRVTSQLKLRRNQSPETLILWFSFVSRGLPIDHPAIVRETSSILSIGHSHDAKVAPQDILVGNGVFILLCEKLISEDRSSALDNRQDKSPYLQVYPIWPYMTVANANETTVKSALASGAFGAENMASLCQEVAYGIKNGWRRELVLKGIQCLIMAKPRTPATETFMRELSRSCRNPSVRRRLRTEILKSTIPDSSSALQAQMSSSAETTNNSEDITIQSVIPIDYGSIVEKALQAPSPSKVIRQVARHILPARLLRCLIDGRIAPTAMASVTLNLLDSIDASTRPERSSNTSERDVVETDSTKDAANGVVLVMDDLDSQTDIATGRSRIDGVAVKSSIDEGHAITGDDTNENGMYDMPMLDISQSRRNNGIQDEREKVGLIVDEGIRVEADTIHDICLRDVHSFVQSKLLIALANLHPYRSNDETTLKLASSAASVCLAYLRHPYIAAQATVHVKSSNNAQEEQTSVHATSEGDTEHLNTSATENYGNLGGLKQFATAFIASAARSVPDTQPCVLICALECVSESYKRDLSNDSNWMSSVASVYAFFQYFGLAPPLRTAPQIDAEEGEDNLQSRAPPFSHDATHHRLGIMLQKLCSSLIRQTHDSNAMTSLMRSLKHAVICLCRVDMMAVHSHMLCIERGEMYGTCQGQNFPSSLLPSDETAHAELVAAALQTVGVLGTPTVGLFKHVWASLMQALDAGLDVGDGEKIGNQVGLAIRGLVSLLYEHADYQIQLSMSRKVSHNRNSYTHHDFKDAPAATISKQINLDGLLTGVNIPSDNTVCVGGLVCLCEHPTSASPVVDYEGLFVAEISGAEISDILSTERTRICRSAARLAHLESIFPTTNSMPMLQPHLDMLKVWYIDKEINLRKVPVLAASPIDVLELCKVLSRRFGQYLSVVPAGSRSPVLLAEIAKAALLLGSITTALSVKEDTTIHTWLSDVFQHLAKVHNDLPRLGPYLLLGLTNVAIKLSRFDLVAAHLNSMLTTVLEIRSASAKSHSQDTLAGTRPSSNMLDLNPMANPIGTEVCLLQSISLLLDDSKTRKPLGRLIPSVVSYLSVVLRGCNSDKVVSRSTSDPIIQAPRFYLDVLLLAIPVVQHYPNEAHVTGFAAQVVKVCVTIAADTRTPEFVFEGIMRGIERLTIDSRVHREMIEKELKVVENSMSAKSILHTYSTLRLSVCQLWAKPLDDEPVIETVRGVLRRLFERLHTASNLEANKVAKLIPQLMTRFLDDEEIVTAILSELLECTVFTIKRLSIVALQVLRRVQRLQDGPMLAEMITNSSKSFMDKLDGDLGRGALAVLFVSVAKSDTVKALDLLVLEQLEEPSSFDNDLFYFTGSDFHRQLSDPNKETFVAALASSAKSDVFANLVRYLAR